MLIRSSMSFPVFRMNVTFCSSRDCFFHIKSCSPACMAQHDFNGCAEIQSRLIDQAVCC